MNEQEPSSSMQAPLDNYDMNFGPEQDDGQSAVPLVNQLSESLSARESVEPPLMMMNEEDSQRDTDLYFISQSQETSKRREDQEDSNTQGGYNWN